MIKRKLNALAQKEDIDLRDFVWSSQSYTLKELLNKVKLPCVVKCSAERCGVEWKDFNFTLTQPLLLHSTRNTKKICVKCLQKEQPSTEFKELDHHLVIPANYEGWFHIIKAPDDRMKPDQTVSEVVASGADQFLVGRSVSGIDLILDSEDGEGEKEINKKSIGHGGILRVNRLYDQELNVIEKTRQKQAKDNSTTKEVAKEENNNLKYVMCFDENEDDVVFPSTKKGFFYRIYDHEETGIGLVSAEDLIDKQDEFPLLVRHVIGEMPMLTATYSSVMKCFTVIEEQTILASTLDPDAMAPLELQVNSNVKFNLSLNDAKVKYSDTYTEALQLCKSDGDDYLRGIKAAFKFRPNSLDEKVPLSKLKKEHVIQTEKDISEKEVSETEKEVSKTEKEVSKTEKEVPKTEKEAPKTEKEVSKTEKEVSEIEKQVEKDTSCSKEADVIDPVVASPNDTMQSETTTNISDDEPSCYGSDMEEEDAQSEFAFEWTENEVTKPNTESRDTERRVQVLKGNNKDVYVPRVFNSSINSPRGSVESRINSWNESPDVV